jgi:hypothetical protein
MPSRRGMEDIKDFNKKRSAASQSGYIPEVFSRLKEDGEYAVVRILTNSPVDVDMHYVFDEGLNRSFLVFCPGRAECDYCHEGDWAKAYFAFWVMTNHIIHAEPDKDGIWKPVKVGDRTMYKEESGQIMLMRKTHGKSNYLWNMFEDIYSINNTFTDGDVRVKRKGAKGDQQTSYTVLHLGQSSMPAEAVAVIGKLPDLVAVMKGEVKSLESLKAEPAKNEMKERMSSSEQKSRAPIKTVAEAIGDDDLFEEKKVSVKDSVKPAGAVKKSAIVDDDDLEEIRYSDEED